MKDLEELAGSAVDCGFRIHKALGPGLLESVYEAILADGLGRAGLLVERLAPVHGKQLLTYLRLAQQPLGLLMNFGGETFKEGVRRVANNYSFAPSPLCVNPLPSAE